MLIEEDGKTTNKLGGESMRLDLELASIQEEIKLIESAGVGK